MSIRTRHPLTPDILRRAPGTALLLHALLSLLLQVGWHVLPGTPFGVVREGLFGAVLSVVLMQGLCVLLPAFTAILLFRLPGHLVVGTRRPGTLPLVLSLLLGLPAAVMLLAANNAVVGLLARSGLSLPAPLLPVADPATTELRLLLSLVTAALPAVSEEILFRGVMQPIMTAAGRPATAVILTALAFAAYHADPLFLVAPLGAGLMLGYLRLRTDHLLPCILTHLSLNLTLIWIQPLLPRLTELTLRQGTPSGSSLSTYLAVFTVSAAVAVPLLLLLGGPARAVRTDARHRPSPPVDWRFWLASAVLLATIVVVFLAAGR